MQTFKLYRQRHTLHLLRSYHSQFQTALQNYQPDPNEYKNLYEVYRKSDVYAEPEEKAHISESTNRNEVDELYGDHLKP